MAEVIPATSNYRIQRLHRLSKTAAKLLGAKRKLETPQSCRYLLEDAVDQVEAEADTSPNARFIYEAEIVTVDGRDCVIGLELRRGKLVPVTFELRG